MAAAEADLQAVEGLQAVAGLLQQPSQSGPAWVEKKASYQPPEHCDIAAVTT